MGKKNWADDKEKIKTSESQIRELEKRNQTKKIAVLLIHQLAGLIEQVVTSTKKWSGDKKSKELEFRVWELEKQNQVLGDYCRGTLPPYPGSMTMKLTAPGGDFSTEEKVFNLAPVTRRGTVNNPLTNLNTSHQGKTSDPSVTGKTPALECKCQILVSSSSHKI